VQRGNLLEAEASARELGRLNLRDALSLVVCFAAERLVCQRRCGDGYVERLAKLVEFLAFLDSARPRGNPRALGLTGALRGCDSAAGTAAMHRMVEPKRLGSSAL